MQRYVRVLASAFVPVLQKSLSSMPHIFESVSMPLKSNYEVVSVIKRIFI